MATFRTIDDAATGSEKPLDTALLNDLAESVEATRESCVRNAVRHYPDPPRIAVHESIGYAAMPILWPHDPFETQITVKLIVDVLSQVGSTPGTDPEITVGVGWQSIGNLDFGVTPQPENTTNLAYSASEQIVTLTCTPTDDPLGVVWIFFKSVTGTWADLTDGAGGTGSSITVVGADWDYGGALISGVATPAWGTADSVPTQAIRIVDSTAKVEDGLPGARQIIYIDYTVSGDHLVHVWPRYGTAGASLLDAGDKWQYADLGYLDLHGIEVYTSGTSVSSLREGSLLDAGVQPAALAPISILAQADEHMQLVTRIHSIGQGGAPYVEGDGSSNALEGVIAWGQQPFDFDGTTYQRHAISGAAIIALTHLSNEEGTVFDFNVGLKLTATDLDAATDSYDVVDESAPLKSFSAPVSWREKTHTPGASLWGWRSVQAMATHALTGLIVPGDFAGALAVVAFEGADDQTGTPGDTRILTLYADQETTSLNGDVFQYAHHVHLLGWSLWTTPARELTIEELGADT